MRISIPRFSERFFVIARESSSMLVFPGKDDACFMEANAPELLRKEQYPRPPILNYKESPAWIRSPRPTWNE
jgi:hypothetical protein